MFSTNSPITSMKSLYNTTKITTTKMMSLAITMKSQFTIKSQFTRKRCIQKTINLSFNTIMTTRTVILATNLRPRIITPSSIILTILSRKLTKKTLPRLRLIQKSQPSLRLNLIKKKKSILQLFRFLSLILLRRS